MTTRPMIARRLPVPPIPAGLAAAAALALAAGQGVRAGEITIEDRGGAIVVRDGGEPFAEYRHEGLAKPVIYPIFGPGGVRMTRDFPFRKDTKGEASDHPHHESLWFTHGDVNGISFWHLGDDAGRIVQRTLEKVGPDTIVSNNEWVAPDGKSVVCTDTRKIRFGADEGSRWIDYSVTVHASNGEVTFGDTKEGTMGIRTHPNLRLTNDEGRGVTTANGKAINSAGDRDKELWGKNAAWVDYWGDIEGKTVGIAIFDHPSNPRHPTTWHARDYGLVAANPFGLSDFQKKPKGAGNLVVPSGESVTFRYRFVFHEGDVEKADIPGRFARWSEEG